MENPPRKENKLESYLELGKRVCVLAADLAHKGEHRRQTEGPTEAVRDRVLIGLAIKAYNTFECLLMDAAVSRPEAFHHLKTLAETYIYFHWVGVRTDDNRAKLLMAKELQCKIQFYAANPEFDPKKETRTLFEASIHVWTNGLESDWKHFKKLKVFQIAQDTDQEVVILYNRVYRQACEPAHMSDLSEFMPLNGSPLSITPRSSLATLKSVIAVEYGLQMILDLFENVAKIYELGIDDTMAGLKTDFELARTVDRHQ